jgi:long-chain acyl-CoA synthetase
VRRYTFGTVTLFRATKTDRPVVETIELSPKRADGAAMSNLALNLVASAARIPDRTAAITDEDTMTYGDADGYYYVVDRKKDLIIRGGYNVYPREVEEALHGHPAVAAVAVIGIPHDSLGEEIGAAVVLKAGASAEVDELRQFVKGRVAAYKYPRRIWLVDSLPTGPTGKLMRREVKPPPSWEA